ncbi:hypothetical protein [Sediminispirochaeta bajacaliforniensis]|uniref:hypothetical protein n=1 Tax=Sediminispirochaeta bajacaliforniensis TaxID=148 RepID=UPI00035F26BC|nr:hypothetical protein [Sediminispirochaeta bajacaliforniensis]
MRKVVQIFLGLSVVLLLVNCTSTPDYPKVIDRGEYNPDRVSSAELARLYIHNYIAVLKIDDADVDWNATEEDFARQVVRIPSGIHVLTVKYDTGKVFTMFPMKAIGKFDAGKDYMLEGMQEGGKVRIKIYDMNEGMEASLNLEKLQGNDESTISQYIKYVLNPTMEENNHSVKLENEEFLVLFKPDMIYEVTNKHTGETKIGRRGFEMDFTMTNAKTYLLEVDPATMTRDEFLETSDYKNRSKIVMIPIACDGQSVTYTFVKPEEQAGEEISFSISELADASS